MKQNFSFLYWKRNEFCIEGLIIEELKKKERKNKAELGIYQLEVYGKVELNFLSYVDFSTQSELIIILNPLLLLAFPFG